MIKETVKILAIDGGHLWVEGVQRSACHTCSAQQGCGQSVLAKFTAKPVRLPIALDGRSADSFYVGQDVTIGIANHVVVRGSVLIYVLPLLLMLSGIGFGDRVIGGEVAAMACGFLALFVGGWCAGRVSNATAQRSKLQAQLLDV